MTQLFRYLLAFGLTWLLLGGIFSYAQHSDDTDFDVSQAIVEFFETPQPEAQLNPSELTELPYSVTYIRDVAEAAFSRDVERLLQTVQATDADAFIDAIEYDERSSFAEAILTAMKHDQKAGGNLKLISILEGYLDDEGWFLRSIAGSILSHVYMTQSELLVSAGYVQDAIDIIPSELSPETTYARLVAAEGAMSLHAIQGNPVFLLEAARIQKRTRQSIGKEINRYELMTNFIYALNEDRDFSGAAEIAELLIAEPVPDNAVPGLAETYMAETYNALAQYMRALSLSENARLNATHPVILRRSRRAYLIALAGLGRETEARNWMVEWGLDHDQIELLTEVVNPDVLYAEALLAMNRGDTKLWSDLLKRWTSFICTSAQRF
ncbi:MAG: hypothetical protein AAFP97_00565, partial [Pseudomonadota bacterium]